MWAQLPVHRALSVLCTTVAFVQLAKGAHPKPVILRTYNTLGVIAEELLADACMDPVAANELIVRIVASVDDDKAAYRLGFSYVDPEIGHLLMGTQAHSASGLMRAKWSNETILANRLDDGASARSRPATCGRPPMRAGPS